MEVTMKDQRLEKLARVLVEYSTGVKPGDNVCVSGEDSAIPFIKEVVKQAILAGGNVKWFVDMPELDEFLLKNGRAGADRAAKLPLRGMRPSRRMDKRLGHGQRKHAFVH